MTTMTTTKRMLAVLLFAVVTSPANADFNAIARALDDHHGVNRVWIPFLGVARLVVRVVEPEGVNDFQLATFEGTDGLDARELQSLMRAKAGPGFVPLVQVWSRKSNEWSFIYARPHENGNRIELLVLAHDDDETVLVRVDVDADVIAREINHHPRRVIHVAGR